MRSSTGINPKTLTGMTDQSRRPCVTSAQHRLAVTARLAQRHLRRLMNSNPTLRGCVLFDRGEWTVITGVDLRAAAGSTVIQYVFESCRGLERTPRCGSDGGHRPMPKERMTLSRPG